MTKNHKCVFCSAYLRDTPHGFFNLNGDSYCRVAADRYHMCHCAECHCAGECAAHVAVPMTYHPESIQVILDFDVEPAVRVAEFEAC